MKVAIRIFVLSVVVASAAAAAVTPKSSPVLPSHQSATSTFPTPGCGPYICPPDPGGNGN